MSFAPELFYPLGAFILLGALIAVVLYYRRRGRDNDPVTERAARELNKDPEHYPEKREKLNKQLRS